MLRPANLTTAQLTAAVKPALGHESQFYICPDAATEIGTLEITGANSGVWTEAPDSGAYDDMRYVVAVIDNGYKGEANITVAYGGNNGTFKPPGYATLTEKIFQAGFGAEVIKTGNVPFTKPAAAPSVTCNADAVGTKITFYAMPDVTDFTLAGCKVQAEFADPSAMPAGVQCGKRRSAFVKEGEVPELTFNLRAKVPVEGDVLTRVSGHRILGLLKTKKDDKVTVMHTYFIGLVMKPTRTIGESMEPDVLNFTGIYENMAMLVALGPTD